MNIRRLSMCKFEENICWLHVEQLKLTKVNKLAQKEDGHNDITSVITNNGTVNKIVVKKTNNYKDVNDTINVSNESINMKGSLVKKDGLNKMALKNYKNEGQILPKNARENREEKLWI